ncbi:MAG: iron-sulfur cluster assembly scaffold protein [Patescibacteria group bacterium]
MKNPTLEPDILNRAGDNGWFYSDTVKDHFFNPRNFMRDESAYADAAMGMVGSPACGDAMKVWIRVDPATERIIDCKWKTFGCGSAIASTSMLSVMATENGGLTLDAARHLRPQDVTARLGGLPARKIHCSVLGDKALRAAVNDWYRRAGQLEKVEAEAGRVVDALTQVTDQDIEHAVLDGADTLEKLQAKLKVGIGNPACLPEVEQLLRFYTEKYFGKQ